VAFDRGLRLLVLVPVARADRIAVDPEVAYFALRRCGAALVQQACFIASDQQTARAGTNRVGPVRDEHVQDFGGTNPVDDVHAEALFETLVQRGRKRLARRDREANAGKIEIADLKVRPMIAVVSAFRRTCRVRRTAVA